MFISINTTNSHERNFRAAKIGNSTVHFSGWLVETFGATRASRRNVHPRDTVFKNHEPNRVPDMSLGYFQNIPIYYTSEKYKLSIRSFLDYFCYTIVSMDVIGPHQNDVCF